jgi:hypothetical protein
MDGELGHDPTLRARPGLGYRLHVSIRPWFVVVVALGLSACAGGPAPDSGCADVVAVSAESEGGRRFTFRVTVRSADTGWDKYADAWEVTALDGTALGTRELLHPHVDEQPFTRSLSGVEVPAAADRVVVRARDSVAGWCGREMTVEIPS